MMHRTVEWLNANRYRRYPFNDDTNMSMGDGTRLEDNVILDVQVTALQSAPLNLALETITISGSELALVFGGTGVAFTVLIPEAATFPYTVQSQSASAVYTVIAGEGCAALLTRTPQTLHCGFPVQPALAVAQDNRRVDTLASAAAGQAVLVGAVILEPGYNCDPSVVGNTIRLIAGRGLGAGRYCIPPEDDVISCGNALLRINGATASEDGNINLVFEGAQVQNLPATNTIVVTTPKMLENMKCG